MRKILDTTLITVPLSTLDRIIPEDEKISFIKVDAEHGDFHILQGAERVLRTSRPLVAFESGQQLSADLFQYTKEDYFSFFDAIDYELYDLLGTKLTLENWGSSGLFYEGWAVPKESKHIDFFDHNLSLFADSYASRVGNLLNWKEQRWRKDNAGTSSR